MTVLERAGSQAKFQKFPLPLVKGHQKLDCSNFMNSEHTPNSHPLFSTEKKFGVIKLLTLEKTRDCFFVLIEEVVPPGISL